MEPERPIEKLLRAWAKKRRGSADGNFELHPANRRLLQNEIARRFAERTASRPSVLERLAGFWPRLAIAAAVLAALAVLSLLFLPGKRLSQNQKAFGEARLTLAQRS